MCAALAGCAEVPPTGAGGTQFELPGDRSVAVATQGVTVRTRFVLVGHDALGTDDAALDDLFVNLGAIFLDPSDDSSVAYSSRDPFALQFDVASGQTDVFGPELVLPTAGDFFVSVQVEPGDVLVSGDKGASGSDSVVARGRYLERSDVDLAADEPSPLPWQPKDMQTRRSIVHTVDFTYRSDAVARIQLGEVALRERGTYELVLTIDVTDWLREDVLPAVRDYHSAVAVARSADVRARLDDELDLDASVDDPGAGVHGLIGGIGVGARRF